MRLHPRANGRDPENSAWEKHAVALRMLEKKEYAAQRGEMIEKQLRRRGIRDAGVLAAMTAVPRHEFVPEELRSRAYEDVRCHRRRSRPSRNLISLPHDRRVCICSQATGFWKLARDVAIMPPCSPFGQGSVHDRAAAGACFFCVHKARAARLPPTHTFTAATALLACQNSLLSTLSSLPLPPSGSETAPCTACRRRPDDSPGWGCGTSGIAAHRKAR